MNELPLPPVPQPPEQSSSSQIRLPLEVAEDAVAPAHTSVAFDPPWSLRDLILFVLFAGVSTLVLLMAAAVGFSLLRDIFGWTQPTQQALGQVPVLLSIQLVMEGLCVLFIYFTVTEKYGRRFWEAIHWVRRKDQEWFAVLTGIGLAMALQLFSNLFPPERRLPIEDWFSNPVSAYAVALVGISAAPFIEELVFRGFFYPVFERRWGLPRAVLLTSALFAIIHGSQLAWSWREVSAIFVVGLAFSYARGKTGSLVPPFLMHLAYNTTLFATLYISTDRFRTLPG
jgi:membrane protease YdiL (CAAX protease family)